MQVLRAACVRTAGVSITTATTGGRLGAWRITRRLRIATFCVLATLAARDSHAARCGLHAGVPRRCSFQCRPHSRGVGSHSGSADDTPLRAADTRVRAARSLCVQTRTPRVSTTLGFRRVRVALSVIFTHGVSNGVPMSVISTRGSVASTHSSVGSMHRVSPRCTEHGRHAAYADSTRRVQEAVAKSIPPTMPASRRNSRSTGCCRRGP